MSDISDNGKDLNYTEEELLAIITKNQFLSYIIRTMSGLKMEEESQNEVELYKKIQATSNKVEVEVDKQSAEFYIQLFTEGYDSFGVEYFIKLLQTQPEHLYTGIVALLETINILPLDAMKKALNEFNKENTIDA